MWKLTEFSFAYDELNVLNLTLDKSNEESFYGRIDE